MDTKTRILQAAVRLFAEHGLKGASIRDICSEANANIAAVNYYFGGKDPLYAQVIKAVCSRVTEIEPMPEATPELSHEQRLCDWINWYVRRREDERYEQFLEFVRREIADPTSMLQVITEEVIAPVQSQLRELISTLLPSDTDGRIVDLHCCLLDGPLLSWSLNAPLRREIPGFSDGQPSTDLLVEYTQRCVMASLRAYGAQISDRWEMVG